MLIVGIGSSTPLVWHHQGSLPGAFASLILLSETQSVIIVLTNSLALIDCPNWVGQLLLEELLDVHEMNDYVELSKVSAPNTLKWYPSVVEELRKAQKPNTTHKPLDDYVGMYWNKTGYMKIEITRDGSFMNFRLIERSSA